MEKSTKEIFILNLAGPLSKEVQEYFSQKNLKIVDPNLSQEICEWTHILTKNISDFTQLNKTYRTIEKDISIISLSKLEDPQNFILCNGKLVLDEIWFKGPFGSFILDKLLLDSVDLQLNQNYPKFTEVGAFNVVNPFSTGDYVDRLVQNAFDGDFSALSIRTYFDHILTFLVGLKTKGKAGLPFEISYGSFNDVFALQIHFYADGLLLEDLIGSFSPMKSKKPEEFILTVAINSVDFFDFTYISQVGKVVLTGLWSKDSQIKFENKGFLFSTISSQSNLATVPFYGVTSNLIVPENVKDHSEKVNLTNSLELQEVSLSGAEISDSISKNLSSEMDLEKIKRIFSNQQDLEDEKINLGSSKEELDEVVNRIKGIADQPESVRRISGGKLDVDNFVQRISGGLSSNDKGAWKVKSLGTKVQDSVRSSMFNFAKKMGKDPADLTNDDLKKFKEEGLSEIATNLTESDTSSLNQMMGHLKTKLNKTLKDEFVVDSVENLFESIKSPDDVDRVKNVLIEALKSLLNKDFNLSSKGSLSDSDKSILIKSLSKLLSIDENKIQEIINSSQTSTQKLPTLSKEPTEVEKQLKKQLNLATKENSDLKQKVTSLFSEIKVLKESSSLFQNLSQKAKESASQLMSENDTDQANNLVSFIKLKLERSEGFNNQEMSYLLNLARENEKSFKQQELESSQKDVFFNQEIEKSQRQIKSRDLMITKTKEALQAMSDKKDLVINDLKLRIDGLSVSTTQNNSQSSKIIELEKQNQNFIKMIDMYKEKITVLSSNPTASKQLESQGKQELKKLEMMNTQMKNQIETMKKELQRSQERISSDNSQITFLKNDKLKLEAEVKRLTLIGKKDGSINSNNAQSGLEIELKKVLTQNQTLEMQLRDSGNKLREVEKKLSEALKNPQKQNNNEDSLKKATQLEGNVKKLSQDLIESKNNESELKKEVNKLKQEKTALQNQIDKLKKDMEKNGKPASNKKAGAA